MLDDDIRSGLFQLAEDEAFDGNLERVRSVGTRKRQRRQGIIALASLSVIVAIGFSVSGLSRTSVAEISTDVANEGVERETPEPEKEFEATTSSTERGSSTSKALFDPDRSPPLTDLAPNETTTTNSSPDTSAASPVDDAPERATLESENTTTSVAAATTEQTAGTNVELEKPPPTSESTSSSITTSKPVNTAPRTDFVCQVSTNGTISWTDHEQSKYWVRRSTDGGETFAWIGRTLGETTFIDTDYQPGYQYNLDYDGLWPRVNCAVSASLACQVNSIGVVTWTDQKQTTYAVHRLDGDGVGYKLLNASVDGLTYWDSGYQSNARYRVSHGGLAGQAECEEVAGFACLVTGEGQLRWTDHDKPLYWIYRSVDGGATYTFSGNTQGATSFTSTDHQPGDRYQLDYQALSRRPSCVEVR